MIHSLQNGSSTHEHTTPKLTEREMEFLKLTCTELTYKEIADQMNVSPRTVDGYRDALFEKLGVKSRVGLCLYAVRMGL
jgi:DNA-binding CsgD family transcriptional regulator